MELIKKALDGFERLKSERVVWNTSWQVIAEFVNTKKADFTTTSTGGEFLNNKVFNNSAQAAVKARASTVKAMILGNYDFKLEPSREYLENASLVEFFQQATEILKEELQLGGTGFNKSLNQTEDFEATFGTSVLYSDFADHLNFKCLDLKECYIDEDYTGEVDVLYRSFSLTARQAKQKFGIEALSRTTQEALRNGNSSAKINILNVIAPIDDYLDLFDLKVDFGYVSLFIERGEDHLITKQGYDEKPFFVHREGQKTGEKYGRSPSFDAISLISQVNTVTKSLMLIVNRYGLPPLGTTSDLPFVDISAGAMTRFQATTSNLPPIWNLINETGDPGIIVQYINELEEKIAKFYGLDRLLDFNSTQQMTATEVEARSKIRNSTLADLFQSKIDEKYTPVIIRSFNLLFRNGKFDKIIEEHREELLDILESGEDIYGVSYYNQIEREKNTQNNQAVLDIWNSTGAIANMTQDLSVFDGLDADKTVNLLKTMSFTNEIFRGQPDIQNIREQRQKQQIAAAALEQQAQQAGGEDGSS